MSSQLAGRLRLTHHLWYLAFIVFGSHVVEEKAVPGEKVELQASGG